MHHWVKHCKISKRCPEYISMVVKVSSCSYQKTILGFVRNWVFEFCHNLSLSLVKVLVLVWSQFFCCYWSFEFGCSFRFFSRFKLSFITIWVFAIFHNLIFLVLLLFEFLYFAAILVLSFVTIWVLEFCYNLSFCQEEQLWKLFLVK